VFSAAAANQIASWSTDKQYSIFTHAFLKAMSGEADEVGDKNGKVSLEEIKAYLRENVSYWARRHYGRDQFAEVYGERL